MSDSRALTRYDGPRTTAELREYAQLLAFDTNPEGQYKRNDALPVAFRGNPGAVAFAVEYGKALDVSPITALIGIHIVDGKPTASAGLISALVRRAGHKIRTWTEGTVTGGDLRGITTITRDDDPEFEYRSEWTLERAVRAGLCQLVRTETGWTVTARGRSGKPGGWETYTESMVKARSITEAARDAAEDAILGVHYTPEELGVEVDEAGEPVYTVTQVPPTTTTTPAPSAAPVNDTAADLDDLVAMAEEIREQILACETADELSALWNTSPIIAGDNGGASKERAAALTTGDADGVEVTILDLFGRYGQALRDGMRDAFLETFVGVIDGEIVEDGDDGQAGTPAQDPPSGDEGPSSDSAAPSTDEPPVAPESSEPHLRPEPIEQHGPNRQAFDLVLGGMSDDQRAATLRYVDGWEIDWRHDDRAAAEVLDALGNEIVAEVQRLPGPSVAFLVVDARAQIHEKMRGELAEDHADAAAEHTGAGTRQERRSAAAAAARATARAAKEARPPE